MRGSCHTPAGRRAWVLLLVVACAWPTAAWADDEPTVTVPDVRRRRIEDAMNVLEAAGLKVGDIYEFSRERVAAMFKVRGVLGTVFLQKPTPGTGWPRHKPVHLIVVAEKDGKLPPDLVAPRGEPRDPAPEDPAPEDPAPRDPAPRDPAPKDPAPRDPAPTAPTPTDPPPRGPAPTDPPPREPAQPAAGPTLPGAVAEGSPDAPRPAPPADPNRVPDLLGLDLAEAEMLVRDAEMTLHVERVPGHPVGKVLEQVPGGGTPRPAGGVVKVVITAGGDFEARMPGPPAVHVDAIAVPSLLDRTKLQAQRIVEALGLEVAFEEAKRGLPGRVVDQHPAAGAKVAKGGLVRLFVGPGAAPAPGDAPPKPGPIAPSGDAQPTPADEPEAPAPQPPLPEGPLKAGVPQPVSPGVNTAIPAGTSVPVGFTWRGVTGANAYILELEEMGAEGRWLPLARKPARTTAVLMDVERLDPQGASKLRWRVTAVVAGRRGTPSAWVVLR